MNWCNGWVKLKSNDVNWMNVSRNCNPLIIGGKNSGKKLMIKWPPLATLPWFRILRTHIHSRPMRINKPDWCPEQLWGQGKPDTELSERCLKVLSSCRNYKKMWFKKREMNILLFYLFEKLTQIQLVTIKGIVKIQK